jgi:hypothetical protein
MRQLEEAKSQLAIFTPLQMEAFSLSKDLLKFIESLGPYPVLPNPKYPRIGDSGDHIFRHNDEVRWPWVIKLKTAYEADYSSRLKTFLVSLGREGQDDMFLSSFKDQIKDLENIHAIRARLWVIASRKEKIDLTKGNI